MTTTAVGVGAVWAGEEQVQVHEGRRQEEEESMNSPEHLRLMTALAEQRMEKVCGRCDKY